MDILLILFYISTFFHVIFLLTAIINVVFGPFLRKIKHDLKDSPLVSVMIPARNEERNIAKCLDSMLQQDYPNYEIIVLDDNSEDATWDIISEYAENHEIISAVRGGEVLPGWTGKNNACRQLYEKARGEILVFTDADNSYAHNAISNSIKYLDKYSLDYLSVFPQQITKTLSEKLIIPFIDVVIYSFFILWSQYFVKWNIFAAANGQWIVCRRKSYEKTGKHDAVKGRIVEDVALFREAKKKGMRTLTCAGTSMIYGRMYHSFREIWQGLSKNIFGIADYNTALFLMINLILLSYLVFPCLFILLNSSIFVIVINFIILVLWRLVLAINYKHNIAMALFFHPILILIVNALSISSIYKNKFSNVEWKGRKIVVRDREITNTYE